MKKIIIKMQDCLQRMTERWQALSFKQQQRFILIVFAGYLLLSVTVILKAWYGSGHQGYSMSIEHIGNPMIRKKDSGIVVMDSISIILKKRLHEFQSQ